jgi:hypothetical protein
VYPRSLWFVAVCEEIMTRMQLTDLHDHLVLSRKRGSYKDCRDWNLKDLKVMGVRQHAGAPLYEPKQSSDIMSLLGTTEGTLFVMCIRRAPLTPLGESERDFDSKCCWVSSQSANSGAGRERRNLRKFDFGETDQLSSRRFQSCFALLLTLSSLHPFYILDFSSIL